MNVIVLFYFTVLQILTQVLYCRSDVNRGREKQNGLVYIKINEQDIVIEHTSLSQTDYDAVGYYGFIADEIINVTCQVRNSDGALKFDYHSTDSHKKTPLVTTNYIQNKRINMQVKLTQKSNNSYIDCTHRVSEDVQVVRIFLEQQPDIIEKNELSIRVNGLKPRLLQYNYNNSYYYYYYEYLYGEGEIINVTCTKNQGTDGTITISQIEPRLVLGRTTDNKSSIEILTRIKNEHNYDTIKWLRCYNALLKTYVLLNLKPSIITVEDWLYLRGPPMGNILFQYQDNHDITRIHYEYENNDILNLIWGLNPNYFRKTTIIYLSLSWKGDTIWSVTTANTSHEITHNLSLHLRAIDDGLPIVYLMTKTGQYAGSTIRREIQVIPTLTSHNLSEQDENNYKQYLLVVSVGVGIIVVIIIMIWVTFSLKSRKPRTNIADYDSHANHPRGESPIPPFPSQWEQYAQMAPRPEPFDGNTIEHNNKEDLYSNAIHNKNERNKNTSEYPNVHLNYADLAFDQNLSNRVKNEGGMAEPVEYAAVLARSESERNTKLYANACTGDRYANTDANDYVETAYGETVFK